MAWPGTGHARLVQRPAPRRRDFFAADAGFPRGVVEFLVGGRLQQADTRRSTASKETRS